MKEKPKAASSIAGRLNLYFGGRMLAAFFYLDLVILAGFVSTFFYWVEKQAPGSGSIIERYFSMESEYLYYIVEFQNGGMSSYDIFALLRTALPAFLFVLIVEAETLVSGLFHTREIRRILRPLNDLARQAEELSRVSFDNDKFRILEEAISHMEPDARLVTGERELQSLEVAVNNMLDRIRESNRRQSQFVSDASHELRTPISVIQGYVNLLDRWGKEDSAVLEEAIDALKNEADHMQELVEQLLFLARGDSGRNRLKPERFVLSDLLWEVCEECRMIDGGHEYAYVGEENVVCTADVAMIKQTVRIFTDNAAKYSAAGGRIKLSAFPGEGCVRYVVQDEGEGISAGAVSHVFDRFYRSDEARNSTTGGSGLGLSIAKWIVEAHGGVIEVLSREEFGTRFTVELPQGREKGTESSGMR
ncbi:MAG: HAMP domain-containing histidine kinase [Lachnospiraceae bacterium]|nr:HAMP domain-containing histidine kinase [Lachnospiraceae bacterium]